MRQIHKQEAIIERNPCLSMTITTMTRRKWLRLSVAFSCLITVRCHYSIPPLGVFPSPSSFYQETIQYITQNRYLISWWMWCFFMLFRFSSSMNAALCTYWFIIIGSLPKINRPVLSLTESPCMVPHLIFFAVSLCHLSFNFLAYSILYLM